MVDIASKQPSKKTREIAFSANIKKRIKHHNKFSRFIRLLGPGVVTGAADDDPSGIATYSQAGAKMGYGMLWAFPIMYPLLLAVQESCSRIGAVTGKGLAAVIKENFSRKTLFLAVALVTSANVINIGADLGALASTTQLFVDLPFVSLVVLYSIVIIGLVLFVNYKRYARMLKWLALALLSYPVTAFIVGQDWGLVFRETFLNIPTINKETMFIFVGLIGTTISPYLFFWDTSEVVEEEISKHRLTATGSEPKINKHFIRSIKKDNFWGMTLASVTAWFIVVACAGALHQNGVFEINTAQDAARALEPLVQGFPNAGLVAKIIFSIGIIGTGLLAIPVLAGSSAYAISESLGWKEGLYRRFSRATGFYVVIILATLIGVMMNFLGIDPISALLFTAVFNGIAAIPLLWMIAKIGSSEKIMGQYKNSVFSNAFVKLAFYVMLFALIMLILSNFVS